MNTGTVIPTNYDLETAGKRLVGRVRLQLEKLDKGMIRALGRIEQDSRYFIPLLRRALSLKLMSCLFLEFSV